MQDKVAAAALLVLLAGCAQPSTPGPSSATTAPAPTQVAANAALPGGLDGTYYAPAGGASASRCQTKINAPIRVQNGMASIQLVTAGTLQGPVSPDGSLAAQSGANTLTGKFADGRFAGTLSIPMRGTGCQFDMQYSKR